MNDAMVEKKCQEFLRTLKALRGKRGLSTTQLATLTGLKQPNIVRIETGVYKPNLETIIRLTEVLEAKLTLE